MSNIAPSANIPTRRLSLISAALSIALVTVLAAGCSDSEPEQPSNPTQEAESTADPAADTANQETAIDATPMPEPVIEPDAIATLPILNAASINLICDQTINDAKADAARLAALPMADVSVETLLNVWDASGAKIEDGTNPPYLLAYVSPIKAVRDAGQACILKISQFQTEIYQNRALYERFSALQTTTPVQAQYRQDILHAFEDSGVTLPEDKRERAKQLSQEITALSQDFQKNIRENKDTVTLSPTEVDGMSEQWLAGVKQDDDGNYLATFDNPVFSPFISSATNADARKRYMHAFSNRGGSENLRLLDEIIQRRHEIAQLHGLDSYAHLITARRMVNNPETVHNFLDEVADKVTTVEQADLSELAELKDAMETQDSSTINRWDMNYYKEKLKQARYSIDEEALRQYFPTDESVEWGLEVAERLYGLKIRKAFAPIWHEDVRFYEVYRDTGQDDEMAFSLENYIGSIYLDLFPRDGKYKHAAAFGVRSVSTKLNRKPISVLVTNFNREGLTHREAETLFHEFGHVLHGVLSQTEYTAHAGTSVSRDFVEAPSQMFEAWVSRRESLDILQSICTECPVISDDMLTRLQAAQSLGQGIHYARQHLYASFDMALAGPNPQPAQQVWVKMESATPMGHMPGTEFPATFGHIAGGYASGYYGYMWSEVLAKDMLSAFGDNVMDEAVGRRYLEVLLSQGGQKPAKELVEDFLGRPVNSEAFFNHISGESE